MTRHPSFMLNSGKKPALDPSPNALTPEERQHVYDRLQAGCSPAAKIVRKLMRLHERHTVLLGACRCTAAELVEAQANRLVAK